MDLKLSREKNKKLSQNIWQTKGQCPQLTKSLYYREEQSPNRKMHKACELTELEGMTMADKHVQWCPNSHD